MVDRFFRYGELPLVLLALLERRAKHGYELMSELDALFAPDYTASPGSVYPALGALKSEGLLEPLNGESPKRYRITQTGTEALASRLDKLADLEHRRGVRLRADDDLDAELGRLGAAVRMAARKADHDVIAEVLRKATERVRGMMEEGR